MTTREMARQALLTPPAPPPPPAPAAIPLLDTFTLFPDLPVELRLMIWTMAMPGRRMINIFYDISNRLSAGTQLRLTDKHTMVKLPPPTGLLHACSESREVALQTYTRFGGPTEETSYSFLDPTKDLIALRQFQDRLPRKFVRGLATTCGVLIHPGLISRIQHLATNPFQAKQYCDDLFNNYTGLKKVLILVHGDWRPDAQLDCRGSDGYWEPRCERDFKKWRRRNPEKKMPEIEYRPAHCFDAEGGIWACNCAINCHKVLPRHPTT